MENHRIASKRKKEFALTGQELASLSRIDEAQATLEAGIEHAQGQVAFHADGGGD